MNQHLWDHSSLGFRISSLEPMLRYTGRFWLLTEVSIRIFGSRTDTVSWDESGETHIYNMHPELLYPHTCGFRKWLLTRLPFALLSANGYFPCHYCSCRGQVWCLSNSVDPSDFKYLWLEGSRLGKLLTRNFKALSSSLSVSRRSSMSISTSGISSSLGVGEGAKEKAFCLETDCKHGTKVTELNQWVKTGGVSGGKSINLLIKERKG